MNGSNNKQTRATNLSIRNSCTSMCNGVFSPVCAPMVCNIPRMPQYQDLVIGSGNFHSGELVTSDILSFRVHVYRMMHDYLGDVMIIDPITNRCLHSNTLVAYHAGTEEMFTAIFHMDSTDKTASRELAVYGRIALSDTPAAFYVYSAPLTGGEIRAGGELVTGNIRIEADAMEMEH